MKNKFKPWIFPLLIVLYEVYGVVNTADNKATTMAGVLYGVMLGMVISGGLYYYLILRKREEKSSSE